VRGVVLSAATPHGTQRGAVRPSRRAATHRARFRARSPPPHPGYRGTGDADDRTLHRAVADRRSTHEVTNQVPAHLGWDVLAADTVLGEALARHVGPTGAERLGDLGRVAGSGGARDWADQAEAHPPVLRTHDARGARLDEVDHHPAYHRLLCTGMEHGLGAAPWAAPRGTGAHATRAAGFLVWTQVDAGHGCPLSMTYAAVLALRADPELASIWEPRLTGTGYEAGLADPAGKRGVLAGMGMTEKQGGSDVRANTTRAEPVARWRAARRTG